jgi:hypothetical protein
LDIKQIELAFFAVDRLAPPKRMLTIVDRHRLNRMPRPIRQQLRTAWRLGGRLGRFLQHCECVMCGGYDHYARECYYNPVGTWHTSYVPQKNSKKKVTSLKLIEEVVESSKVTDGNLKITSKKKKGKVSKNKILTLEDIGSKQSKQLSQMPLRLIWSRK